MSNYSKTTNFTAKDALSSGDPNKVIKGSEHDTEFDNIATASATKANKIASATNNNVIKQDAAGDLVDSGYSFSELSGDVSSTAAELNLGVAKAWVHFNGSAVISASHNVSGVVRNTTGDYTVTFTTAMTDDDYVVSGMARTSGCFITSGDTALTTTAFTVKCLLHNGTATDSTIYAMVVGN